MRLTLLIYVLLMPFMSALAPAEWFPLPLLFLMLIAAGIAVRPSGLSLSRAFRRDAGFWIMFSSGVLGMVFSSLPGGMKNLNYSLAILVCYMFFFCVVRALVCMPDVRWRDIGRACQISLSFLSLAVILEFYLASFHGIFFADIIHFAHDDLTVANFITPDFKRPRAFSAEPGFTALAFECLWPLSFLARRQQKWRHLLFALGFMLLASAAAASCALLAAAIVWVFLSRNLRSAFRFALILVAVLALLMASDAGQDAVWVVFGRKLDIAAVDLAPDAADTLTLFDRLNSYDVASTLLEQHPFGVGWGSLGQAFADRLSIPEIGLLNGSGLLNLYLDIAVAAGAIGLLGWLWFLGLRLRELLSSAEPQARYLAMALLTVCLHHVFVTEIQFPFLWFGLALADKFALGLRVATKKKPRHKAVAEPAEQAPAT